MAKKDKAKKAEDLNYAPEGYVARLYEDYRNRIIPEMMKEFGYKNVMQVPKLEKVTLNMGIGEASRDVKILEALKENLALIAGQMPVTTRAKKSISNFKIREGMPLGCCVTLRRNRMYEFMDRLMNICIPRIRDFRGLSTKSFDGRGNYSMGVQEQLIFPEIPYDSVTKVQGLNICIVTTAKTDEEAMKMLKLFGMPFRS